MTHALTVASLFICFNIAFSTFQDPLTFNTSLHSGLVIGSKL